MADSNGFFENARKFYPSTPNPLVANTLSPEPHGAINPGNVRKQTLVVKQPNKKLDFRCEEDLAVPIL